MAISIELEAIRIRTALLAERLQKYRNGIKGFFIPEDFLADSQHLFQDIEQLLGTLNDALHQKQALETKLQTLGDEKSRLKLQLEKHEQIIIDLGQRLQGIKRILEGHVSN